MMPPFLQPQDLFLYSTLWGFMRLASLSTTKISQVWQQSGCTQGLGESERGEGEKACSIPGHTPATCSSCLPPLLQRAGPPIGLSHIRPWLPAKPHNPQRHKSSTACLNKRAVVAAVPGGCGAGMSFFRCWGPFIKTSVSFGSRINQYLHPCTTRGKKGLSQPVLWTAVPAPG